MQQQLQQMVDAAVEAAIYGKKINLRIDKLVKQYITLKWRHALST